ncbi:MAG: hypothetical protein RL527_282 [Planctomycetota bacterium]|jgi:hypothetical protein
MAIRASLLHSATFCSSLALMAIAHAQDTAPAADPSAGDEAAGTIMGLPYDDPIVLAAGIAVGAIAIAIIVGAVLWMRGDKDEGGDASKGATAKQSTAKQSTAAGTKPGPRGPAGARPASLPITTPTTESAESSMNPLADDDLSPAKPMMGAPMASAAELELPELGDLAELDAVEAPKPVAAAPVMPVIPAAPAPVMPVTPSPVVPAAVVPVTPVAIPVVPAAPVPPTPAPIAAAPAPVPAPVLPRAAAPAATAISAAPIMIPVGSSTPTTSPVAAAGPITASNVAKEWRRHRSESLFAFAKGLYEQALSTRGSDGHLQRSGLVRLLAERGQGDDLKRAEELVGVGGVAGDAIALLRAREQRFDEAETELNRLSLHSANEEVRAAALTASQLLIAAYEKRGDHAKVGHFVHKIEWELLRRAEAGMVADSDVERAVTRLLVASQWRPALTVATEWHGWTKRDPVWSRTVLRAALAVQPHCASDADLATKAEAIRREALDLVEGEGLADLARGLRLAATHDADLVGMARTHLTRAVSGSDRVDSVARPFLAMLEIGQGNLEAAEQHATARTAGAAPGLPELARGMLEIARGRFDHARREFAAAIDALSTQKFFNFPDAVREAINETRPAHEALKGLCATHVATGDVAGARRALDERMVGGPDRALIAQALVDSGLSAGKVHLDAFRFLYPPAGQTSAEPAVLAKLFEVGSRVLRDPSGFTQDERDTVQRMLEALTPGVERPRGRGRFYVRRYAGSGHPLFEVVWLPSDDDPVPAPVEWNLVAHGADGSRVSRLFERGVFTPESKPYLVSGRDSEAPDTFAGARTVALIDPRQIAVGAGDWKLEIGCNRSDDRESIAFRSEGPSHEEILGAFADHRERFVMLLTGLLNPKVGKKQMADVAHATARSFPFDVPSELDAFSADIELRLTNTAPLLSEMEPAALDAMAVRQAATLAAAPSYLRAHIVGLLQSPVVSVAMRADGLRGAISRIQGVTEHADA